LSDFKRFPSWMWRNTEVLNFVSWLKSYNAAHPKAAVRFYGLDLYSMNASREAVIQYLEKLEPEAAESAQRRYGCFDRSDSEAQRYAASRRGSETCEKQALDRKSVV